MHVSNMYGFTCEVLVEGRPYFVQITYVGSHEPGNLTLDNLIDAWGTTDPVALATYELQHRDWTDKFKGQVRFSVQENWGYGLSTDPVDQHVQHILTDRQVLEEIAKGRAYDIVQGWNL